jgi:thiol:disulfide interchange protein
MFIIFENIIRNQQMKSFLFTAFAAFMLLIPTMSQAEMHETMKKNAMMKNDMTAPKVIAALFYADWCGSCQILDPNVKKARGKAGLDSTDVLFITFDLTNEKTRHQSVLLANALGMGDYFAQNEGKTGYLVLFNAESKELVKKIKKDMDAGQIADAIKTNI